MPIFDNLLGLTPSPLIPLPPPPPKKKIKVIF